MDRGGRLQGSQVDISVILHAYQQVDHVDVALRSIFDQQLSSDVVVEVILCDDGSIDGTLEILKSNQELYPELCSLISNKEREQLPPPCTPGRWILMKAISEAKGDLIAFLDGDDRWTAIDKLQAQWDVFQEFSGTMICTHNGKDIHINGEQMDYVRARYCHERLPSFFKQEQLVLSCLFQKASLMIRKDAIMKRRASLELAPSFDWAALALLSAKHPVRFIDRHMADRVRQESGMTSSKDKNVQLKWDIRMLIFLDKETEKEYHELIRKKLIDLAWSGFHGSRKEMDMGLVNDYYDVLDNNRLWRSKREKIRTFFIAKFPIASNWYFQIRSGNTMGRT